MITKITAENELEFFKRGFQAITDAFAADDRFSNIVVDSLATYYENLGSIKELKTQAGESGKFLLVPFDEPIFEIDANARTITVPAPFKKNGVAVQGDHQAELLVFKVDRYFDYKDLFETNIAISWEFIPQGARQASVSGHDAAFAKDIYYDANYVVFGFIITQDMTPGRGVLNFSVNFFNTSTDEPFVYSLNTMIASVNVNEGLTLENPTEVKPVRQSFIGHIGNSSYTGDTQPPIDDPVWILGDLDEENNRTGLPSSANFAEGQDILLLTTKAYTVGVNTSVDMKYKWDAAPVLESEGDLLVEDVGQVAEITNPNRTTIPEDYFETSDIEADVTKVYYIKNGVGMIDAEHPLSGADAQAAIDDDEVIVYELGNSYKVKMAGKYKVSAFGYRETPINGGQQVLTATSNTINSNMCVIPVASKPVVADVKVEGLDENDFVLELPEGMENSPYIYIASGSTPTIKAVIELAEGETEEFGKLAIQLVPENVSALTLEEAQSLTYGDLENGMLTVSNVSPSVGNYQVRIINRKNHTYRISELSDPIQFSEVAPVITDLNISGFVAPNGAPVTIIEHGITANGGEIEGSNAGEVIFTITDNTVASNIGEVSYFVDELDSTGNNVVTPNKFEVINKQFTMPQNTNGIFRVRTENRYNFTMRSGVTGKFIVNPIGL